MYFDLIYHFRHLKVSNSKKKDVVPISFIVLSLLECVRMHYAILLLVILGTLMRFPRYHFQGNPFMVTCIGGSDSIPVKHPTVINASCKLLLKLHVQYKMSSINLSNSYYMYIPACCLLLYMYCFHNKLRPSIFLEGLKLTCCTPRPCKGWIASVWQLLDLQKCITRALEYIIRYIPCLRVAPTEVDFSGRRRLQCCRAASQGGWFQQTGGWYQIERAISPVHVQ